MTIEEAKFKWCPMARMLAWNSAADKADTSYNRNENDRPETLCVEARCACWRWHDPETRYVNDIPVRYSTTLEPIGHMEVVVSRRGFCGLAGVPSCS